VDIVILSHFCIHSEDDMLTKRLSLVAVAAAFAVSSSLAMLQSARPALADADDHHPKIHRHVDRDDRRANHPGYHWANGQWIPNNVANNNRGGHWVNGQWVSNTWHANPGKHKGWKHKKNHDRDRDGDRR
jgi:Ni/Co efflux regulator RcnB